MRAIAILLSGLLLAACTALDLPNSSPTPVPPASAEPAPNVTPEPEPTQPPDPPVPDGELPVEMLQLLLDEVAALSGVPTGELRVDRAEQVTWRDGSLGCPEPDLGYTQALVEGYWIVIVAGGEEYDFRIGASGGPRLCPPGQGEPPLEEDF